MLHISNIQWDVTDGAEDMTKKKKSKKSSPHYQKSVDIDKKDLDKYDIDEDSDWDEITEAAGD